MHVLQESKCKLKCDHRNLVREILMDWREKFMSTGGREFHRHGKRFGYKCLNAFEQLGYDLVGWSLEEDCDLV